MTQKGKDFESKLMLLDSDTSPEETAQILNLLHYNNTAEEPTINHNRRIDICIGICNDTLFCKGSPFNSDGSKTIYVDVLPVNDISPVIDLSGVNENDTGYTTTFIEEGEPVLLSSQLSIRDADHPPHYLQKATVELLSVAGGEYLVICPESCSKWSSVSITGNQSDQLMLDNKAEQSVYECILGTVKYANDDDEPWKNASFPRSVVFTIWDIDNLPSTNATATVELQQVCDPPRLFVSGRMLEYNATTYNESSDDPVHVVDTSNWGIEDDDDTQLINGTIQIVDNFQQNHDMLSVTMYNADITTDYDQTTGILRFSGWADISDYESVISSVTFSNTFAGIELKRRTLHFVFYDTCNKTNEVAKTWIDIDRLNDPPVLNLMVSSQTYTFTRNVDRPRLAFADKATIIDYDEDDVTLAFVRIVLIEAGNIDDMEELVFNTSGTSVTVTPTKYLSSFNITYLLENGATIEEYQTVLRAAVYVNEADQPFTSVRRQIRVLVSDGELTDESTIDVVLDQEPAKPIVSWDDDYVVPYVEDGPNVNVFNHSGFGIIAGDTPFIKKAVVEITNPKMGANEFLYIPEIDPGVPVTITGQSSTVLSIETNSILPVHRTSDYEQWLRCVQFSSDDQSPSECRYITLVVTDAQIGRSSDVRTVTLCITAVNDQPVFHSSPLLSSSILKDYLPQDTNNPGYPANVFVDRTVVTDVDVPDPIGMSIFKTETQMGLEGVWQYWQDGAWIDFKNALDDCNSVLRLPMERVRFSPSPSAARKSGWTRFWYRAWDSSSTPCNGASTLSLTSTSSVSNVRANFTLTVEFTNSAPVLNSTKTVVLNAIDEDEMSSGELAWKLVEQVATDADDLAMTLGFAVVWVDGDNGDWQYKTYGSGWWTDIPIAVNATHAFLIDGNATIRFLPNKNYNGGSSIRFKAWDQSSSAGTGDFADTTTTNVFSGPFSNASTSATIAVNAVNDAPVVESGVDVRQFVENGGGVSLFNGSLTLTDVDSATLKSVTITVTRKMMENCTGTAKPSGSGSGSASGSGANNPVITGTSSCTENIDHDGIEADCLRLVGRGVGNFTVSYQYSSDSLTVTVEGNGESLSEYESILNAFYFSSEASETTDAQRSVVVRADDGTNKSTDLSVTILVTLVNDNEPWLTLGNDVATFTEGTDKVMVFTADPIIADDDCHELFYLYKASASLGENATMFERLSTPVANDYAAVSTSWDAMTGTLRVWGKASIDTYEKVLGSLMYHNSNPEPEGYDRTIDIWVNDGKFKSNVASVTVQVELISDIPIVVSLGGSSIDTTVDMVENNNGNSSVYVAPGAIVIDPDTFSRTSERIEIEFVGSPPDGADERLDVVLPSGVSFGSSSTLHRRIINANLSANQVQEMFRSVQYVNEAEEPNPWPRMIRFEVNVSGVGGVWIKTVTYATIRILLTNDKPQLELNEIFVRYDEGDSAIVLSPNLTITDVDNTTLSSAKVYFSNAMSASFETGQDLLRFNLDGTTIRGNYTNSTGVLLLSGPAPREEFQTVLRTVSYEFVTRKGDPIPGDHDIIFTVNDDLAESDMKMIMIDFATVNNRPVLFLGGQMASSNVTVDFTEEGGEVYLAQGAFLADPDNETLAWVRITLSDHMDGEKEYIRIINWNSDDINVIEAMNGKSLTLTGPADVDEFKDAIQHLAYNNEKDEPTPGDRRVEVIANDGNSNSNPVYALVKIVFVNDPPVLDLDSTQPGTGVAVTFVENSGGVFIASPDVSIVDDDNVTVTQIQVVLKGIVDGNHETITPSPDSSNGQTFMYDYPSGLLLVDAEEKVRQLGYNNVAEEPSLGHRWANVSVFDGVDWSNVAQSGITIQPVNDQDPQFDNNSYAGSVPEEMANLNILQVTATDGDSHNMMFSLTYTIQSGDDGHFAINSTTGWIRTSWWNPPDRETKDVYLLKVRASDGSRWSEVDVNINVTDVNDNAPEFVFPIMVAAVYENVSSGHVVFALTARDDDIGSNAELSYELLTESMMDNPFDVSDSGNVYVASPDLLDYETKRAYNVTVVVSDSGDPRKSASTVVLVRVLNVNEYTPRFVQGTYEAIMCEGPMSNRTVVAVTATDDDAEMFGKITYLIEDDKGIFAVHPETGRVWNKVPLDYETWTWHEFKVRATDGGNLWSEATVTVDVRNDNDNRPKFESDHRRIIISENATVGTSVHRCPATDNDSCVYDVCNNGFALACDVCNRTDGSSGDGSGCESYDDNTLRYEIVSSYPSGFLAIDSETGNITLAQSIDREMVSVYYVTIRVSDGLYSDTKNLTIHVGDDNDNNPVFNKTRYLEEVKENVAVGTSVIQVSASDADAGLNGDVAYRLLGHWNEDFSIDNWGVVWTAMSLDREMRPEYDLMVVAEDMGAMKRTTEVPLVITVLDVNDNSPVFEPILDCVLIREDYGAEESGSGSGSGVGFDRFVVNVSASDADADENGEIVFSIVGESVFDIDSQTGEITSTAYFDREATGFYVVTVNASDRGSPSRWTPLLVCINVTDVNDNAPVIDSDSLSDPIDISEASANGTIVVDRIWATDSDAGANGNVRFYPGRNFPRRHFDLHQNSGQIVVASSLDRETIDEYTFSVVAVDQAMPISARLNDTILLTFIITDANDNSPVVLPLFVEVDVEENVTLNTVIALFNVTDRDAGNNSVVSATLSPPSSRFEVSLVENVATVSVVAELDYETATSHVVSIVFSDAGIPPMSSTSQVNVTVLNVNDARPVVSIGNTLPIEYFEDSGRLALEPNVNITDSDGFPFTYFCNSTARLIGGETYNVSMLPYDCPPGIGDKFTKIRNCGLDDAQAIGPDVVALQNGATINGYTMMFDGSDDFADVKGQFNLINKGLVIAVWLNMPSLPLNKSTIYIKLNAGANLVYYGVFCLSNGRVRFEYAKSGKLSASVDGPMICGSFVNQWAHLTVLVDCDDQSVWRVKFLVNGCMKGQVVLSFFMYTTARISDKAGRSFVGARPMPGNADNNPIENYHGKMHLLVVQPSPSRQEQIVCFLGCGEALRTGLSSLPTSLKASYDYTEATLTVLGRSSREDYIDVLNSLYYVSDVEEPISGTRTIDVRINDCQFESDSGLLTIDMALTNDNEPILRLNGPHGANYNRSVFTEDDTSGGAVIVANASALTVTDGDRGAYTYDVTVEIMNPVDSSYESLSVGSGQSFEYDNVTATLTMSPYVDTVELQAILRSITYDNTKEEPSTVERTISFAIKDGPRHDSAIVYSYIQVELVNDQPDVLLNYMVDYYEGNGSVLVAPTLRLIDHDNDYAMEAIIRLQSAVKEDMEMLDVYVADTPEISKMYDMANCTLKLWGKATVATYERILRNVTYEHKGQEDPTPGPRVVTFTVSDGAATSAPASSFIFFQAVNDAPVLDLNGPAELGIDFEISYAEGMAASVLTESTATLIDVDSSTLAYLKATLVGNLNGDDEYLNVDLTSMPSLSPTYVAGVLKIVPSGSGSSIADFQMALRKITYENKADEFSGAERTVDFVANDGYLSSRVATTRIVLKEINDRPYISLYGNGTTNHTTVFVDSKPAINVLPPSSVSVSDPDSAATVVLVRLVLQNFEDDSLEKLTFPSDGTSSITKTLSEIQYEIAFSPGLFLTTAEAFLQGIMYDNMIDEPNPAQPRTILISVTDGTVSSNHITVHVDIRLFNDHRPIFSPLDYAVVVPENKNSHTILTVFATDMDDGDDGKFLFSFVNGNDEGHFSIDSSTGEIATTTTLDREEISWYRLVVRATDLGVPSMSSDAGVNITVSDVNDVVPRFVNDAVYAANVSENSRIGFTVFNFSAVDGDRADTNNARISYAIVGGNSRGDFHIPDASVGVVTVANRLDVDGSNGQVDYTLLIAAFDHGVPSLNVTSSFTVRVMDVDDNCPYFSSAQYETTVSEDIAFGSTVLTLTIHDMDLTSENQKYSLSAFIPDGKFFIQPSGAIELFGMLDRETKDMYTFPVTVRESPGGNCLNVTNVVIRVSDVNDNKPCFNLSSYVFMLDENVGGEHVVAVVGATDADIGSNAEITYSIWPMSVPFEIHSMTGVISPSGMIDREVTDKYDFYVVATDGGRPAMSCNSTITVSINDLNDNPPIFTHPIYWDSVSENVLGQLVTVPHADDADATSPFNVVSYSLGPGPDSAAFSIDSQTGVVTILTEFDYEVQCRYNVTIIATDGGGLTDTAFLVVTVTNENEHAPIILVDDTTIRVNESEAIGSPLLALSAVDSDGGCHGDAHSDDNITFTLEINPDNVFNLDDNVIRLRKSLDHESRVWYDLVVKATDEGGRYSLLNVTVEVVNENDVAPAFDKNLYLGSVTEGVSMGVFVFTATAVDNDAPPFDAFSFELSGDDSTYFSISDVGIVVVAAPIDFEVTGPSLDFSVVADDGVHRVLAPAHVVVKDLNDEKPVVTMPPVSAAPIDGPSDVLEDVVVDDPDTDTDDIVNATVRLTMPPCISDIIRNTTYGTPTHTSHFGKCGLGNGVDLTSEMLDFVGETYPGYGYLFTGETYGRVLSSLLPSPIANNFLFTVCFGMKPHTGGPVLEAIYSMNETLFSIEITRDVLTFEYESSSGTQKVVVALWSAVDDDALHTIVLEVSYPRVTVILDGHRHAAAMMGSPMIVTKPEMMLVGNVLSLNSLGFVGYLKSATLRSGFANMLPSYSTPMNGLSPSATGYAFDETQRQFALVSPALLPHSIGESFSVYLRFKLSAADDGYFFAKLDNQDVFTHPYGISYEAQRKQLWFEYLHSASKTRDAHVIFPSLSLDDGNWHTLLLTVEGLNAKIYLDGSEVAQFTLDGLINDADAADSLSIGSGSDGTSTKNSDYLNGEISSFIIVSYVIDPSTLSCFLSGCNSSDQCIGDCWRANGTCCLPESERCNYDMLKYRQCGISNATDLLISSGASKSASGFVRFNGVSDMYDSHVVFADTTDFVVSVWLMSSSGGTVTGISGSLFIHVSDDDVMLLVDDGRSISLSTSLLDGMWHHVAVVVSSSKVWLVVDGMLADEYDLGANPITLSSGLMTVGARTASGGGIVEHFSGKLRGLAAILHSVDLYQIQCLSDCREYFLYDKKAFPFGAVNVWPTSTLDGETLTPDVCTSSGSFIFRGTASTANYTTALASIQFVSLFMPIPTSCNRSVTVTASDGVQVSVPTEADIDVAYPNTVAAVLDLDASDQDSLDYDTSLTEGMPSVKIVSATPSLVDETDNEQSLVSDITVTLSTVIEQEEINYVGPVIASINVVVLSPTVLVLDGPAPYADFLNALQGLVYVNKESEPAVVVRTVSFVVQDGPFCSDPVYTRIAIIPRNDNAPVIHLDSPQRDYVTSYVEETAGSQIVNNISITDTDRGALQLRNLTIRLITIYEGDELTWSPAMPVEPVVGRHTDHEIVLEGAYNFAVYEQAVKRVVFRSTADEPASGVRTIMVVGCDGAHCSSPAFATVNILFENDHPAIAYLGNGTTDRNVVYTEGGNFVYFSDNARIVDADREQETIDRIIVQVWNAHAGDEIRNLSSVPSTVRLNRISNSHVELIGPANRSDFVLALDPCAYRDVALEPENLLRRIDVTIVDGSLNSTSRVYVTIVPVDDSNPRFDPASYSASVVENTPPGVSIVQLFTTDDDRFTSSPPPLFSLMDDFDGRFTIDSNGTIFTGNTSIDRELQTQYNLVAVLLDSSEGSGAGSSIATSSVRIRVDDVNDNPVTFTRDFYRDIREDAPIDQFVVRLMASDADGLSNYRTFIDPNAVGLPFVERNKALFVSDALDYETVKMYNFTVFVEDLDVPSHTDSTQVIITILDADDNPVYVDDVNDRVVLLDPSDSVRIAPNATLHDMDEVVTINEVRAWITSQPHFSTESISVALPAGTAVRASYSDRRRNLLLSGGASASEYETIIRSLSYVDNATNLADVNRTVSLSVASTTSTANATLPREILVEVKIFNDEAPSIDLDKRNFSASDYSGVDPDLFSGDIVNEESSFFTRFVEDGKPVAIAHSSVAITDPDASAIVAELVVAVTDPEDGMNEKLAVGSLHGLTVDNSNPHVLVVSGEASPSIYEAVVQSVTYENTAVQPTGRLRVVTVTVNDGRHTSAPAFAYIELVNVNDDPVLTVGDGGAMDFMTTYTEGSGPGVIVSQDLSITGTCAGVIISNSTFYRRFRY